MYRRMVPILIGLFICIYAFVNYFLPDVNSYYLDYIDWKLHLSWAGSARNTLLHFWQLPMWDPYRCGGVPVIGNPESNIFSPFIFFLLPFGPFFGYLIFFIVNLFIGYIGFYTLGKYYKISTLGSMLAGIVYMLSGLYILPFLVGMINFITLSHLPFVIYFFERYVDSNNRADGVKASFIASLMFLSGFHYIPIVIMYMLASTIIHCLQVRKIQDIYKFVLVVVLFCAFSAIKLIPSIAVIWFNSPMNYGHRISTGYSITSLVHSLLSRNQTSSMISNIHSENINILTGTSYDIDENGMYIGLLLFILFVYGFVKKKTNLRRLVYVGGIFLLISFGSNIQPSLFNLIASIPILSAMRVATRYRYIFMVPVALLIGYGFDEFLKLIQPIFKHNSLLFAWIPKIFILCIAVDLLYVNMNTKNILPIQNAFKIITPNLDTTFYNRCDKSQSEYEKSMNNQGNISCISNVIFTSYAHCVDDKSYKGEVYSLDGNMTASIIYFSPNIFRIYVTARQDDILIVNQNYGRGWKATSNEKSIPVLRTNNLLSTKLSKGNYVVTFSYVARIFIISAFVSIISSLGAVAYLWIHRKDQRYF